MGEFKLYKEVEGMKYPQEDLNIERYHVVMVTHALRKYKNVKEASKHLGVTARTVFRMINRYDIDWKIIEIDKP